MVEEINLSKRMFMRSTHGVLYEFYKLNKKKTIYLFLIYQKCILMYIIEPYNMTFLTILSLLLLISLTIISWLGYVYNNVLIVIPICCSVLTLLIIIH